LNMRFLSLTESAILNWSLKWTFINLKPDSARLGTCQGPKTFTFAHRSPFRKRHFQNVWLSHKVTHTHMEGGGNPNLVVVNMEDFFLDC
jgi:hypothetical protein